MQERIKYLFRTTPKAATLKINAIKTLRLLTGLPLKEAKEAVEGMIDGRSYEFALRTDTEAGDFLQGQQECPEYFVLIQVNGEVRENLAAATTSIMDALKRLIHDSIDTNHVDLSIDLLTIYKKHTGSGSYPLDGASLLR